MNNSIIKIIGKFLVVFITVLITGYLIKAHDNIINSLVLAFSITVFNLIIDKIKYNKSRKNP